MQNEGGGLKETDGGRQRFELELEFVQCLANPTYIHYLAQNRYFDDEAFVGYLKYLQYWQRPEYAKFIVYPHTFFFIELLQSPHFHSAMAHPANKEVAHRKQFYFWKHHRNNRLKHILPRPLPEEPAPPLLCNQLHLHLSLLRLKAQQELGWRAEKTQIYKLVIRIISCTDSLALGSFIRMFSF